MREILYKAKRVDTGEWVQGYLFDNGMIDNKRYFVGGLVIEEYKGNACDEWDITGIDFYEIDASTICQYTGRVDKNGQNIWENDILVAHLDEKFPEDATYEKVIWHDCGFHTKDKYSDEIEPFDDFTTQYFAVCGNIFDNAELLERKE